jgi:hypothetical protein
MDILKEYGGKVIVSHGKYYPDSNGAFKKFVIPKKKVIIFAIGAGLCVSKKGINSNIEDDFIANNKTQSEAVKKILRNPNKAFQNVGYFDFSVHVEGDIIYDIYLGGEKQMNPTDIIGIYGVNDSKIQLGKLNLLSKLLKSLPGGVYVIFSCRSVYDNKEINDISINGVCMAHKAKRINDRFVGKIQQQNINHTKKYLSSVKFKMGG